MFKSLTPLILRRAGFAGRLETAADGWIHGWAVDRTHPTVRLSVFIADEGERCLEARADRYRADLHAAGWGDGHHGFAVPLTAFDVGATVRARIAGTRRELTGSPLLIRAFPKGRTVRAGSIQLHVDAGQRSGRVTGWVVDRQDATRRLHLGLRRRGIVVAETRATRHRDDIDQPGFDPLHGFVFLCQGVEPGPCDIVCRDNGLVLASAILRA